MSKRTTKFKRRARDCYDTPRKQVSYLLPHLWPSTRFGEPCAGAFKLAQELEAHDHICVMAGDVAPRHERVNMLDVMDIKAADNIDMFITNTLWPLPPIECRKLGVDAGEPSVSIALHLSDIAPTWMLFSADFAHNTYFNKLEDRCVKIVSAGRAKWIPGSKHIGMENCAWYLFHRNHVAGPKFIGKRAA